MPRPASRSSATRSRPCSGRCSLVGMCSALADLPCVNPSCQPTPSMSAQRTADCASSNSATLAVAPWVDDQGSVHLCKTTRAVLASIPAFGGPGPGWVVHILVSVAVKNCAIMAARSAPPPQATPRKRGLGVSTGEHLPRVHAPTEPRTSNIEHSTSKPRRRSAVGGSNIEGRSGRTVCVRC